MMPLQPNDSLTDIKYLKLEPPVIYLPVGQSGQVRAYAVLTSGRQVEVSAKADWSMPPTNVATVTDSGVVSAVCPGSSMVVARYGQHRAEGILVSIGEETEPQPKQGKRRSVAIGIAGAVAAVVIGGAVFAQMTPQQTGGTQQFHAAAKSVPATQEEQQAVDVKPDEPIAPPEPAPYQAAPTPQLLATAAAATGTAEPAPAVPRQGQPAAVASAQAKPAAQQAPQKPTAPVAKPIVKKESATTRPAARPKAVPPKKAVSTTSVATQPKRTAPPRQVTPRVKDPEPAERNGKWGYIKRTTVFDQELVIPYQYDHATSFSEGLAMVKKDGKFGYINKQGELVIPFQFEYATPFTKGTATVKRDGKLGTIDKSGAFIN